MKDNTTITITKSTKRVVQLTAEEVEEILASHFGIELDSTCLVFWEYDFNEDTISGVVFKQETYVEEEQ